MSSSAKLCWALIPAAETWRRVWGGRKIFRGPGFLNYVFFQEKMSIFALFILSRASDNTTSLNIGGTNAWAVLPPQILGEPSPSPPPLLHSLVHCNLTYMWTALTLDF